MLKKDAHATCASCSEINAHSAQKLLTKHSAGAPRAYDPDPRHPSGLPGDEVYRLEQGQRRRERGIRRAKRELAGARACYDHSGDIGDLASALRAQDNLRNKQASIRSFIERANNLGNAPVLRRNTQRELVGNASKTTLAASARSKMRARKVLDLKKRCRAKRLPIYDEGPLGAIARQAYPHYRRDDGYAVVSHGLPDSVLLLNERADHETLADIIMARSDYTPGTPVRLLACSTGRQDGNAPCIAQRLADELGVDVTAPNDILWVFSDGTLTVGPRKGHNTGTFITYHPRRQK